VGNVDHFRQVDPAVHLFEKGIVVSPVLQPFAADVAANEPDLVGAGLFAQTGFAELEFIADDASVELGVGNAVNGEEARVVKKHGAEAEASLDGRSQPATWSEVLAQCVQSALRDPLGKTQGCVAVVHQVDGVEAGHLVEEDVDQVGGVADKKVGEVAPAAKHLEHYRQLALGGIERKEVQLGPVGIEIENALHQMLVAFCTPGADHHGVGVAQAEMLAGLDAVE